MSEENDDRLHECNSAVLEPGLAFGEVWAAYIGEQVGAVAIWSPPGVGFWDT